MSWPRKPPPTGCGSCSGIRRGNGFWPERHRQCDSKHLPGQQAGRFTRLEAIECPELRPLTAYCFAYDALRIVAIFTREQAHMATPTESAHANTQFIDISDRRLAFRTIGTGQPLCLLVRYRGTMDDWDPLFLDTLASQGFQVTVSTTAALANSLVSRATTRPLWPRTPLSSSMPSSVNVW